MLAGSLVMGVLAARFRDSPLDWFVRTVSYTNAFAPSFWVALLAIYVFSVWLGWLRPPGRLTCARPAARPSTSHTSCYRR